MNYSKKNPFNQVFNTVSVFIYSKKLFDIMFKLMKSRTFKLSLSITDLPLNISIESVFCLASELKLDGVEIYPGMKTFPYASSLLKLVKKYKIPVITIHYPIWVTQIAISINSTFKLAKKLNSSIVIHPLNEKLNSHRQIKFLKKVSTLAQENKINVFLENLPRESTLPIYKYFSKTDSSLNNLRQLNIYAKKYNFGLVFDTSHYQHALPYLDTNFLDVFKNIKNIHLSDFNSNKQHLNLGEGILNFKGLLNFLIKNKYQGIVTLEYSPRLFEKSKSYLEAVKTGIGLVCFSTKHSLRTSAT